MVAGTNTKKYNPGFLSDSEIVASFCIRNAEFASLLESLHASEGNANVHSLVIGPRGSGKTHLLLRVAAEVRRDDRLSAFYPDRVRRGELRGRDGGGVLARVPESLGRAGLGG